jgi:hypothetical protein
MGAVRFPDAAILSPTMAYASRRHPQFPQLKRRCTNQMTRGGKTVYCWSETASTSGIEITNIASAPMEALSRRSLLCLNGFLDHGEDLVRIGQVL